MVDFELTVDEAPSHDAVEPLRAGLTEHSAQLVAKPGFRPLAIFARDRAAGGGGELLGGAYGFVNWNWLDVSLLWVAEPLRGQGLGSKLLARLEAEARERGCQRAHLETFSYQARVFYERHGYRIFALLPDYPPGHEKVYLEKALTDM
jgi:GNAT superfamily N-acetyltransferase